MSSMSDAFYRPAGTRHALEFLGSSVDTGLSGPLHRYDEGSRNTEELGAEDSLESLTARLNIEKRIQYGAEKFLEALDSPTCSIPVENRPALKAKVGQELEGSNAKIRDLKAKMELLSSPQKFRRKAQPMLNGFGSSISLAMAGPIRQNSHGERNARALSHVTSSSTLASSFSSGSRLRSYSMSDQVPRDFWESSGPREDWTGSSGEGASYGASPQSAQGTWAQVDEVQLAEARSKAESALARLVKIKDGARDGKWSIPLVQRLFSTITSACKLSPQVRVDLRNDTVSEVIMTFIAEPGETRLRAVGYRLCRYLLTDKRSWAKLRKAGLEWLLIKSFVRIPRSTPEIEQAVLLIRAVIALPATPSDDAVLTSATRMQGSAVTCVRTVEEPTLSDTLVRALVSSAEASDDHFSAVCLETLAELAVFDIRCLRDADAYRILLQAAESGDSSGSMGLCGALLALFDSPGTRSELPLPSGLEVFMSPFTQAYGKGAAHLEQLRVGCYNTCQILRTWSGLFHSCLNDRAGILSLVEALKIPVIEMREALLDLLFSLLRIEVPAWFQPFLDIPNAKLRRRQDPSPISPDHDIGRVPPSARGNLDVIDQFVSLLLAMLVEGGLVEALVNLVEEGPSALMSKATLLLGEVLTLANHLLPIKYCTRVQALPRLFEMAAKFETPEARTSALSALAAIDLAHRNNAEVSLAAKSLLASRQGSQDRGSGSRQLDQVKARLGMQMDDRQFQSLLVESQLLATKDHTKWNFEVVMEIIEGPLLTARRLEEAFVASKFGRRLLHFLHPRSRRFSDIRVTRSSKKWIKVLLSLIRTLLTTPEGIKLLVEDKLLKQILECFSELDQYAGQPSGHPFFSKARVETTLTKGYFDAIGLMSEQMEGMRLLEQFGFFTCFYHLTELKSRDDLIRAIIERFDYKIDGHPRIILSKALTSSYMHTRLFATQHLGHLVHGNDLSTWGLDLLVTQLYDPARQVYEAAAHYIELACDDLEILEAVVKLHPILDHLGDTGQALLMRFLSTSVGFSYLRDADYVDREMDEWFFDRNLQYVIQVESFLSNVLNPVGGDAMENYFFDGTTPPHFYGEITKTEEGCRVLREKGHFMDFVATIREHGMEETDVGVMFKLKSVLWAVGHIGSTLGGIPFLDDEEIVESIVQIAETSPVMSIRGTCFFVLGLISTTMQGAEILDDHGWLAATSSSGLTTGLCLPDDLSKFTLLAEWAPRPPAEPLRLPELEDPAEKRILSGISALSNEVVGTQALGRLQYFKTKQRHLFRSIDLFARVCYMLSTGHFKQVARAYAINMFDVELTKANLEAIDGKLEILKRQARDEAMHPARVDGASLKSRQNDLGKSKVRRSVGSGKQVTTNDRAALEPRTRVIGFEGFEAE